jgi:hypothetical protein
MASVQADNGAFLGFFEAGEAGRGRASRRSMPKNVSESLSDCDVAPTFIQLQLESGGQKTGIHKARFHLLLDAERQPQIGAMAFTFQAATVHGVKTLRYIEQPLHQAR